MKPLFPQNRYLSSQNNFKQLILSITMFMIGYRNELPVDISIVIVIENILNFMRRIDGHFFSQPE